MKGGNHSGPRLRHDYADLLTQGKLKSLRKSKGCTLQQIADYFEVHLSAVHLWETGKTIPSQEHYDELVKYYFPNAFGRFRQ